MPTLTKQEMDWISVLLQKTGALAKDCIIEDDRIIFLVNKEDTGRVIGKGGQTIKALKQSFGKNVFVVEFGDTVEKLAENSIAPIKANHVKLSSKKGKKTVTMYVQQKDKGRAIGKGGSVLKRSRMLLKRHFDIDNVFIDSNLKSNEQYNLESNNSENEDKSTSIVQHENHSNENLKNEELNQ